MADDVPGHSRRDQFVREILAEHAPIARQEASACQRASQASTTVAAPAGG